MNGPGTGVLPDRTLKELISAGFLSNSCTKINPASIDLPLSDEIYRLNGIFLPRKGETVRSMIEKIGGWKVRISEPLEVGSVYLIRLKGPLKLPQQVYGYANPKSSTGRLNLFCRLVVDGVYMFDSIPLGWSGEAWMLVRPDSFPVKLAEGFAVSQLRLFDGKAFVDRLHMELIVKNDGLIFTPELERLAFEDLELWQDSVMLTIAVGENFGLECRGTKAYVDYSKSKAHRKLDYFERIEAVDGEFTLRKGGFYILSTKERVMVPPYLSAELRAIDVRLGDFRSHAAGYIDPGWGFGENGEVCGRPITLEVIPFEEMRVHDGQLIARLRYEWMKSVPDLPYDDPATGSNYLGQSGPQASKHFYD